MIIKMRKIDTMPFSVSGISYTPFYKLLSIPYVKDEVEEKINELVDILVTTKYGTIGQRLRSNEESSKYVGK